MKNLFKQCLYTLGFCLLSLSCTEDALEEPALSKISNTEQCENCLAAPLDLIKRVDRTNQNVTLGTVDVCQVDGELCFRYAAAGGTIGSIKIGIFGALTTIEEQNNNPSPKNFNFEVDLPGRVAIYNHCIPLADIAQALGYTDESSLQGVTLYITTVSQISGGDGTVGGQGWAGTLVNNKKYPFDRYFTFTIGCDSPPMNNTCLFTQGYWFAKPNVLWPGATIENYSTFGSVSLGGYTYSRTEARNIFSSTNKGGKTDAKQAWLQAAALQLSLDNNPALVDIIRNLEPGDDCYGVLDDLSYINNYFSGKGKQTGTSLNSDRTKNPALRDAATRISNCLNTHDNICDSNAIPMSL